MTLTDNTCAIDPQIAGAISVAVMLLIFTGVGSLPVRAAGQQAASTVEAAVTRNGKRPVGLAGHGFVRDASGAFTTIEAPRAGAFTVVFHVDDSGTTAGAYVDRRGTLHGFLRDQSGFTPIDFPGAKATLVARMNAAGQIVGAYGHDDNTPALQLPHGFLLDDGVFTKIDVPGALETRPFGINNRGQVVGEYVDADGRSHGFLLDNGLDRRSLGEGGFTTIDAPGSAGTSATDIDDSGRIVGISGTVASAASGFLRDADGAFTPIAVPNGNQTYPFGINNRGQVVGRYLPAVGPSRGFLLDAGVYTNIVPPDATGDTTIFDISDGGGLAGAFDLIRHGYVQGRRGAFTTVDHPDSVLTEERGGINNRGQIVGAYRDVTGKERGFLRDGKDFTSIEVPGAQLTLAYKINDRGQIVGAYTTDGIVRHGFLLNDGVLTTIDVPGAPYTQAFDIDSNGQIVGEYQDAAGTFHGFLRDTSGAFTTIDLPGTTGMSITGMNDRGQMIGVYGDAAGAIHAFLLHQGVVTTIDVRGAVLTIPEGINNHGQVVGVYVDGVRGRGFMLSNGTLTTPAVPPGTFGTSFPLDIDDRGRIFGVYF